MANNILTQTIPIGELQIMPSARTQASALLRGLPLLNVYWPTPVDLHMDMNQ